MTVTGFDFETFPFGPRSLAPQPVCVSLADEDGTGVVVASCEPEFEEAIEHAMRSDLIVTTNGAFDASVIVAHAPRQAPLVWKAYREDRFTDISIREQLINLAEQGAIDFMLAPNGAKQRLGYSQADLEKKHLGIDRSEEKDDEDSWRRNYSALLGMPARDYPAEAYNYSRDDAVNCVKIAKIQEQKKHLLRAQFLTARAGFALYLNSCWGFEVDRDLVEKLFVELSEKFHEKNFPNLIRMGLLRTAVPPRPHKRQHARAVEMVGHEPTDNDWTPHVERLAALGIKFTEREEPKYSQDMIRALVEKLSTEHDIPIRHTETGLVSFADEVQVDLKGLDPTFDEYIGRQEIAKLVTTELPRMRHGRVHPKYRVMVKTSRTSSFGNKKTDKDPPYPAVNIQQIDPRARAAYRASPGHVLCSIDYNYIELVSAAQKCLDLFGTSVLADKINAGYDPHAYLGASLARRLDPSGFKWSQFGDENYQSFLATKTSNKDWFKHWRGLAKPTGLGFPGGLGARRFVGYAKSTYGVDLVKIAGSMDGAIELAKTLKQEWLDTFPEFEAYFRWVTQDCRDLEWGTAEDERYVYVSPAGTIRSNCFYTDATNGAALQTPTAEGAKIALFMLAEAMMDDTLGSCLRGVHQAAFIHDEVILDIPYDQFTHERATEAARLWREGMAKVMTKVKVGAEPALMFWWDKAAEPVYDENKRLIPWQPK